MAAILFPSLEALSFRAASPLRAVAAAAVRVRKSLGLRMSIWRFHNRGHTVSWAAPAYYAISIQYDAKSSVADANDMLIFVPHSFSFFVAATAANAATTPATEIGECKWAVSIGALSFFFTVLFFVSLLWNHLPVVLCFRALTTFEIFGFVKATPKG